MRYKVLGETYEKYWQVRERLLNRECHRQLTLPEVREIELALYGVDAFHLYGMDVCDLVERGGVVLGRTMIEACSDSEADLLAEELTANLDRKFYPAVVIEHFAGTANLSRRVGSSFGVNAVAYEASGPVFRATLHNLQLLRVPVDLRNSFFGKSVNGPALHILDPPWTRAFRDGDLYIDEIRPSLIEALRRLTASKRTRTVAVIKLPPKDGIAVDRLSALGYPPLLEVRTSDRKENSKATFVAVEV